MFLVEKEKISRLAIHQVGNGTNEEPLRLGKSLVETGSAVKEALYQYFFSSMVNQEGYFHFIDNVDLELNKVYSLVKKLFASQNNFLELSEQIAQHLYDEAKHPKIKGGDLYIAYYKDCYVDDTRADAVGIFKCETKSPFIKLNEADGDYNIAVEHGIDISKLDKGCIIFNVDREEGYKIMIKDNKSTNEALYWANDFLHIEPSNDNYHQTSNYLGLAKSFIVNQLPNEYEVEKTDKINYLNRSVEYFKTTNQFNEKDFAQSVFEDKEVVRSFKDYKKVYEESNDLSIDADFTVSELAVKKQARVFKSVIKLDRNFHVYVHGDKELIERGYDAQVGKHYYKIYFDQES